MNKRYIDFVPVTKKGANPRPPVKVVKKSAPKKEAVKESEEVEKPIVQVEKEEVNLSRDAGGQDETKELPIEELFVEKTEFLTDDFGDVTQFGVIEDYHPKFVQVEVKKRPLGAKPVAKPAVKPAVKTASAASGTGTAVVAKKTATKKPAPAGATRANFINVGKIEKRPLSKNIYVRDASGTSAPKQQEKAEASKKPVVIIAKPEKDSKVGLIVAVILTIILGAAAGTVAFLLLPK